MIDWNIARDEEINKEVEPIAELIVEIYRLRAKVAKLEAENARLRLRVVELEDYEAPVNLSNMNIPALKQEVK